VSVWQKTIEARKFMLSKCRQLGVECVDGTRSMEAIF